MVYSNFKIEWYPYSNNTWSETPTEITKFFDPIIREGIGTKRDTFSFKIQNFNNNFDNIFGASDKIVLYYGVNTNSLDSNNVVMNGILTDIPLTKSNVNILNLKVNNYSETLMNAIAFVDGAGLTVPQFIEQSISHVGNYNQNFKVTWSLSNPTVKQDLTPFPAVTEKWYNKSLLKLLEKYIASNMTEDGN